jgi:hypothetical protein
MVHNNFHIHGHCRWCVVAYSKSGIIDILGISTGLLVVSLWRSIGLYRVENFQKKNLFVYYGLYLVYSKKLCHLLHFWRFYGFF